MLTTELTKKEVDFMSQSETFLELFLKEKGYTSLAEVESITSRLPFPAEPVFVQDFRALQDSEHSQIVQSYNRWGLAHIFVLNPDDKPNTTHPMLDIAEQLKEDLNLHYPLQHHHENHPESVARFGPPDGTMRVYDLPKPVGGSSFREQAETSEVFEAHSDGTGTAGRVQTVGFYLNSAPLFGGFTFFYDIAALAVELAKVDMEAFRHLFLPDAIATVRPRGKGAIKVISPVLFLNEEGEIQVHFRRDSGEYKGVWRQGCAPLDRAREFLHTHTKAFALGSYFVPFSRRGQMCLARNRDLVHGRTAFIDGQLPEQKRMLSRKWFMRSDKHDVHRLVPTMAIRADYAALFPEIFGEEKLIGRWRYDAESDTNYRVE